MFLFTSGTSGKPKEVVISHRNVIGNVSQFHDMLDAKKTEAIRFVAVLSQFGSTVTLWYPLIQGVRIVTYPDPFEVAKWPA